MDVLLLGARGRTGRLLADALAASGHRVVPFSGDVRDAVAVRTAVVGTDAVVSALGPRTGDRTLHRDAAEVLVAAMSTAGVSRFVGISGAGVDVPGDLKSVRDRVVSWLIHRIGGDAAQDKEIELARFAASDLDWTFVRPPRLTDGPGPEAGASAPEHHAHRSPRRTSITRAELAAFVVEVVDRRLYVRQAPLVAATPRRPRRTRHP